MNAPAKPAATSAPTRAKARLGRCRRRSAMFLFPQIPETVRPATVETLDNRAVGPVVAMAALGEVEQGAAHRLQRLGLAVQLGGARERKRLHFRARAAAVGPEREQDADLL